MKNYSDDDCKKFYTKLQDKIEKKYPVLEIKKTNNSGKKFGLNFGINKVNNDYRFAPSKGRITIHIVVDVTFGKSEDEFTEEEKKMSKYLKDFFEYLKDNICFMKKDVCKELNYKKDDDENGRFKQILWVYNFDENTDPDDALELLSDKAILLMASTLKLWAEYYIEYQTNK